ncbi:MAG: AsnC family transcriptional regulator [Candidatus Bathyarchaeia archaeon]|jgi:DNA-binding Lrp family transcriptional regulator|nr:AsnC family transcriptional regulator [Candidatus Bathyarchaeota archaeon]
MRSPENIPNDFDMALISFLQAGIPIEADPYREISEKLGLSRQEIISRIKKLHEDRIIRRVGASIVPSKLGYEANGMVVCEVSSDKISQIGEYVASLKEITHCYERKTIPNIWNYNVFFMIHGLSRSSVEEYVSNLMKKLGINNFEILFSVKELKKTSVMF